MLIVAILIFSSFVHSIAFQITRENAYVVSKYQESSGNRSIACCGWHMIPKLTEYMENGTTKTFPLLVDVNLHVTSFSSVSIVDMDFTIDFILRQRWLDYRLEDITPKDEKYRKPITHMKDIIWLPDLFFRNAKGGFVHAITQQNYFIWIDSHSVVTFSQKLSLKASCHMDLKDFPMDTQDCKLDIGSYGYGLNDLTFRWWRGPNYTAVDDGPINTSHKHAVDIPPDLRLNDFYLKSHDARYCSKAYNMTGLFACLQADFSLKRQFGFYLTHVYIPSTLIVIIAWISFLVDPLAVPARVMIGMLSVLALITQSAAILSQLPKVSYIKSIDLWFFICLAFVVSSLLEYAVVSVRIRRRTQNTHPAPIKRETSTICQRNQRNLDWMSGNNIEELELNDSRLNSSPKDATETASTNKRAAGNFDCSRTLQKKFRLDALHLDFVFGIIYPLCFLIFNIIYWSLYL